MSKQGSAFGTGVRRWRRSVPLRVITAMVGLALALVVGPAADIASAAQATSSAGSQSNSRDVDLDVEVGLAGVIGAGVPVPVRITITSKRAQTVSVDMNGGGSSRQLKAELSADAPTVIDVTVASEQFLDVTVRNSRGRDLVNRSTPMTPDAARTVVGIGSSLFSKGVPENSPTIGGIQQATLLALTDEVLARPGALSSMSAVVLDAGDLDRLSQSTRDALRQWVWAGGDLVLDIEPRAELPVIGEPSTGKVTPIGSGWVRFTSGVAAQGAWSSILEPAPVRTGVANFGVDVGWILDSGALVTVGFIPTWIVAVAVFGSALVGGPIAWFLLRSRRRRLLLWGVAPGLSILVALGLLVAGHSVFTGAETRVVADVDNSIWSGTGRVFSGLKSSTTLELPAGAQLIGANPASVVSTSGSKSTVDMDLPRNSFGAVAVGGLVVDKTPRLEVKAVALDDGTASVTVTNNSDAEFRDVTIAGNSRVRSFKSVQPGTSETLPFQMSEELNVFDTVFGAHQQAEFGTVFGPNDPLQGLGLTQARGLILISGVMDSTVDSIGLSGKGLVSVRAVVPVQPAEGQDGTAALRIDEVGGMSVSQRQQLAQMEFDGPSDGFSAPTSVVGELGGEVGGGEQPPDYVRLTSQRGRKAQTCGVATNATNLDVWNGTAWTRLEKVGVPYIDTRQVGSSGEGHEMQDWMIPAVEAGGRLHMRISGWHFASPASMLFQCGARP